ncbi:MAG: UDP-N-acetylmuramoyl-tripeptide--D-alanyl-D-alanine ligase [Betaproteobacteria bacterium]
MHPYLTMNKIVSYLPESEVLFATKDAMELPLQKITSDSRRAVDSDLFIAIKGDTFDGNNYLKEVFSQGVRTAIASNKSLVPEGMTTVVVKNTVIAIQTIGNKWREETNPLLTIVTGSNGKTTVKEMIAEIFKAAVGNAKVWATPGNLNNEIGLPLTLLQLNANHQLAVIEVGMNHPGETRLLANIAKPNISIINNAQREHQEFMQSVEAVALEHADAIRALPPHGIAIFPSDSEYSILWREVAGQRACVDFEFLEAVSQQSQAVVQGLWDSSKHLRVRIKPIFKFGTEQILTIELAILGKHNAKNALAAVAVGIAAGVALKEIKIGLENFRPVKGRMRSHQIRKTEPIHIIDDTYNANPDSVIAAIDVLAEQQGDRWLILGDMGEVGPHGKAFHEEVGVYAQKLGIEYLFGMGELAAHAVKSFKQSEKSIHVPHMEDLLALLKEKLLQPRGKELHILVKGSRFTKMERAVDYLLLEGKECS